MKQQAALVQEYLAALEEYDAGKRAAPPSLPVNRAFSSTVGWLGLWKKGELVSMPGGRLLVPPAAPVAPSGLPDSYYKESDGSMSAQVPLGPAVVDAEVVGGAVTRLTVDLGNTFPEVDESLAKADFGTATLGLVPIDDPSAAPTPIAGLPYDEATYVKTAGLVDVTPSGLSSSDLASSFFVVTVDSVPLGGGTRATATGLTESLYTAATDDRGVYVDQPAAPWDPSAPAPTCAVQVRYLGGAPPAGTTLGVAQYQPRPAIFATAQLSLTSDAPGGARPSLTVSAGGAVVPNGGTVPVTAADGDDFGTVTLSFQFIRPGMPTVVFSPLASGAPSEPAQAIPLGAFTTLEFAVARALPFDNALATEMEEWLEQAPALTEVNARVYATVFELYHFLYPVMAFLDNPLTFQAWRGRIVAVTDPAIRTSARYMPVMRALSAGKRRILELWDRYASTPAVRSRLAPPRVRR